VKVIQQENSLILVRTKPNGKLSNINLSSVYKLHNWGSLTDQMINYCSGKSDRTISTWVCRIVNPISIVIDTLSLKALPNNSFEWELFIRHWYGIQISSSKLKSSLSTRVSSWNSSVQPFLEYIQQRGIIPLDVIIPKMKPVSESVKNSSFTLNLISDSDPVKITAYQNINKLLAPISLSRTDAEYLDEVYYELGKRRDKLHECLHLYWKSIKTHYDFGKERLALVNKEDIRNRVETDGFYTLSRISGTNEAAYLRRRSKPIDTDSFSHILFILKSEYGQVLLSEFSQTKMLPSRRVFMANYGAIDSMLPKLQIESASSVKIIDRIDWCLGCLSNKDVSFIVALLMMLNPKFTFESLLNCRISDKNGKALLESVESGKSFSIEKARAKSIKKESLNELSIEIIETILEMTEEKRDSVDRAIHKRLFLTASKQSKNFVAATESIVIGWLTGRGKAVARRPTSTSLAESFPSLAEYDLNQKGAISHSKIRTTEGVLEWFRTGSIKAASKILGNSKKVALDHYIPKELVSAFNARKVRLFQNLLIVAATENEDYMLDAVDFNTEAELHRFIMNMIDVNGENKNPLIDYLKNSALNQNGNKPSVGELIPSISEQALISLYVYRESALQNNISAEALAKVDDGIGVSPLAFINLSSHISMALKNHVDLEMRSAHEVALAASIKYSTKVNWGDLLLNKEILI
jgi:hypothetical protein